MIRKNLKIVTTIVFSMFVLGLAGCGSSASNTSADKQASNQGDKKIVLKFGESTSPDSAQVKSAEFFKQKVEQLSGGKMEVQIYPNSQLGDQGQQLEALKAGSLELTTGAATNLSTYSKMWSVFSLPYLFKDRDHMQRVLNNQQVRDILEKNAESNGFKILGYYYMGSRSIINNKRPITKPEDLKGLKIRVMPDPILAESINAMGANGTPVSWGEVYSALQQGVIDGLEQSAPMYVDSKTYEVAKYFSLTDQFIIPNVDVISLKVWNNLTKDAQDIILKAAKATEDNFPKMWDTYEQKSAKVLQDNGVKINQVDKNVFKDRVKPIYDKFTSQIGKDLVDKIQQIQ